MKTFVRSFVLFTAILFWASAAQARTTVPVPRNPNTMARLSTFAHLWELNLVRNSQSPKPAAVSRVLNNVYIVSQKETYEFRVSQVWPSLVILYQGQNIAKNPFETEPQFHDRLEQIFKDESAGVPTKASFLEILIPSAYADWSSFGLGVGASWLANRVFGSTSGGSSSTTVNNVYFDLSGIENILRQDVAIKKQLADLLREQNEELRTANASRSLDRTNDVSGAKALDKQVIQSYLQKSFGNDNLDFLRKTILHDPILRESSCSVNADKSVTSNSKFMLGGKLVSISKSEPAMGMENLGFKIEGSPAVEVRSQVSFSNPGKEDEVKVCTNGSCKPAQSTLDASGLAQKNRPMYSPLSSEQSIASSKFSSYDDKTYWDAVRRPAGQVRQLQWDQLKPGDLQKNATRYHQNHLPGQQGEEVDQIILKALYECAIPGSASNYENDQSFFKACMKRQKTGSFMSPSQKDKVLAAMYKNFDSTFDMIKSIRNDKNAAEVSLKLKAQIDAGLKEARTNPVVNHRAATAAVAKVDACSANESKIHEAFKHFIAGQCDHVGRQDDYSYLYCDPNGDLLNGAAGETETASMVKLLAEECAFQKAEKDMLNLQHAMAFATYQYRCCQYQHCSSFMDELKKEKGSGEGAGEGSGESQSGAVPAQ